MISRQLLPGSDALVCSLPPLGPPSRLRSRSMQGAYRIWAGPEELVEAFVAAPGPAGWRYFGRGRDADTGEELFRVDYVVDAGWDLVRFRSEERRVGKE